MDVVRELAFILFSLVKGVYGEIEDRIEKKDNNCQQRDIDAFVIYVVSRLLQSTV